MVLIHYSLFRAESFKLRINKPMEIVDSQVRILGLHLVKVLVQEQSESIWTLFASIRVHLVSSTEIDERVDVLDPCL